MGAERGSDEWFDQLTDDISMRYRMSMGDLADVINTPSEVVAAIEAHQGSGQPVQLNGWVRGSLSVEERAIDGGLNCGGTIDGDIFIAQSTIGGELHIGGVVEGDLTISNSTIEGSLYIDGAVRGSIFIANSKIVGEIKFDSATVGGGLHINGAFHQGGTDEEEFNAIKTEFAQNSIGGDMTFEDSLIKGELDLTHNLVDGSIIIGYGNKLSDVWIASTVAGAVMFGENTNVDGRIDLYGTVSDGLVLICACSGRIIVQADFGLDGESELLMAGARFAGPVVLAPANSSGTLKLMTVEGAQFTSSVFIGDGVDISRCNFRSTVGLDNFELVGADLFPPGVKELELVDHLPDGEERIGALERASINRQLRSNLESRNNRPATDRFYRGEMNARLDHASEMIRWPGSGLGDWVIITGYKYIAGYGLSVWRPLFTALVIALFASVGFAANGLDLDPAPAQCSPNMPSPSCENAYVVTAGISDLKGWPAAFTFTARSMVSFLSPPEAQLGLASQWLQMVVRFAGPALLALTLLAIRGRVAR